MATPGRNSKSRPKRDIADVKGGLLTTLINLFDENETREVGKDHFVSFAAALGYDCPESSWQSLLSRFGSGPKQEGAFKFDDTYRILDISLVGDHFVSKYDDVLEEVLRRLISSIVALVGRVHTLERHVFHRDEVERERLRTTVLRRWKNKVLSWTFEAWAKMAREQHALLVKAVGNWKNAFLSTVFRRWTEMVEEVKHQRQVMTQVAGRMRNRMAAMAFAMWKEMIEEVRAQKWAAEMRAIAMLKRMLNAQAAQAFSAWCAMVQSVKHQRQVMTQVAGRIVNRLTAMAFANWLELVAEAKRHRHVMGKVAGRMRNRVISIAFEDWHEWVIKAVASREETLRRIANRLCNRTITFAFETWVEQVDEKKRVMTSMRKMVSKMLNALLAQCFETWVEQIDEKKRVMTSMRKIASRMLNALTGKCFDAWIVFIEDQQRIMRRAAHAIGPGWIIYATFTTWTNYWREAVAERVREAAEQERQAIEAKILEASGSIDSKVALLQSKLDAALADAEQVQGQILSSQAEMLNNQAQMQEQMESAIEGKLEGKIFGKVEGKVDARMRAYFDEVLSDKMAGFDKAMMNVSRIEMRLSHLPAEMDTKLRDMEHNMKMQQKKRLEEEDEELKKQRVNRLIRRWLHMAVTKSFDAWVKLVKMHQEKTARAAAIWARGSIHGALHCWADMARERARLIRKMRNVVARMNNRVFVVIFSAWANLAYTAGQTRRAKLAAERKRAAEEKLIAELDEVGARWFDSMVKDADERLSPSPDRGQVDNNTFLPLRDRIATGVIAVGPSGTTSPPIASPRKKPSFSPRKQLPPMEQPTRHVPPGAADETVGRDGDEGSSDIDELSQMEKSALVKTAPRKNSEGLARTSRTSLLQALDGRYMPLQTIDIVQQGQMREVVDQQRKVLQHLMKLDDQNHVLKSILTHVVTDPSALAALERVARSSPTKAKAGVIRPLRESEPGTSGMFTEGIWNQQEVERILAGAAAKGMSKSRSIPVLGGASVVPGEAVWAKKPLPPLPVEDA